MRGHVSEYLVDPASPNWFRLVKSSRQHQSNTVVAAINGRMWSGSWSKDLLAEASATVQALLWSGSASNLMVIPRFDDALLLVDFKGEVDTLLCLSDKPAELVPAVVAAPRDALWLQDGTLVITGVDEIACLRDGQVMWKKNMSGSGAFGVCSAAPTSDGKQTFIVQSQKFMVRFQDDGVELARANVPCDVVVGKFAHQGGTALVDPVGQIWTWGPATEWKMPTTPAIMLQARTTRATGNDQVAVTIENRQSQLFITHFALGKTASVRLPAPAVAEPVISADGLTVTVPVDGGKVAFINLDGPPRVVVIPVTNEPLLFTRLDGKNTLHAFTASKRWHRVEQFSQEAPANTARSGSH